jgi:hypothetical protein
MPSTFVVLPAFPDVPIAPGVPPVARALGAAFATTAAALVADAAGVLSLFSSPQWGVFDLNGSPVIVPDSIFGFEFRREFRLSNFPVEQGGFGTYNKVALPFEPRVTMTSNGENVDRATFLAQVDAACSSLNLYSVVTPEVTYPSVNLTHYDYRRQAQDGATLLTVDLWFEEVRITATSQFTQNGDGSGTSGSTLVGNTKASTGTPPVNGGTVQTDTLTPTESAATTAFA